MAISGRHLSRTRISYDPAAFQAVIAPQLFYLPRSTMKILHYGKDGGPESTVHGFWLIEIKWLFSIALLRFSNGSRDSYHSHAFNSISWLLKGRLHEHCFLGWGKIYKPSIKPIITRRSTFHKVVSEGVSWVFTIRGPWSKTWREFNPISLTYTTLTNGRVVVDD